MPEPTERVKPLLKDIQPASTNVNQSNLPSTIMAKQASLKDYNRTVQKQNDTQHSIKNVSQIDPSSTIAAKRPPLKDVNQTNANPPAGKSQIINSTAAGNQTINASASKARQANQTLNVSDSKIPLGLRSINDVIYPPSWALPNAACLNHTGRRCSDGKRCSRGAQCSEDTWCVCSPGSCADGSEGACEKAGNKWLG